MAVVPADVPFEIDPPEAGGNKGKLPALARTREGHNLYALGYSRGRKKGREESAQADAQVEATKTGAGDNAVAAAQEVFEKWFCEDLGLDMDSAESKHVIRRMLNAAAGAPADAGSGDAIARSKRILALVDDYHENPTADTRTALRKALMAEFEEPLKIDAIAAQWDGCMYHGVGQDIDIGAAIRAAWDKAKS
ncbi:hypothetical protein WK13_34505 [Burkholderia ubonensis]|nr:hypothetical protein WK13_34505 [Burkholderia ubonensis]